MSSNRKPRARGTGPGSRTAAAREQPGDGQGVRLQKVLASAGIGSRRAAEALIEDGRVTVDGSVVRVQGMRVDPRTTRIEVDGERINVHPDHEYIVINKPSGYITTANDPESRRTVFDLVRSKRRLFSVGRLDAETTGLLLLTTDGELAQRMAHPRYGTARTYAVEVRGRVEKAMLRPLTDGIALEDGMARASAARVVRASRTRSHIEITLSEGRNREVRRMFDAIDLPVVSLARIRFGPLRLRALEVGKTRRLTPDEVGQLLRSVGM